MELDWKGHKRSTMTLRTEGPTPPFEPLRFSAAGLALGFLWVACGSSIDASLDNKKCSLDGECLRGYVCSPDRVCVKEATTLEQPQNQSDAGLSPDAAQEPDGIDTGNAPMACSQGVPCEGMCVDLERSVEHCGACGRTCPGSDHGQAVCSAGTCAIACDDGYTRCGDRCYQLSADPHHCGSCSFSCPAPIDNSSTACVEGKCQTSCNPGFQDCNGACVQLETDPSHCGACGTGCAGDQQCAGGVCVKECPAGTIECDRGCVDTKTDARHCGACGQICTAPENGAPSCRDGACTFDCKPGLAACGNACVDTQTDLANCGACGNACPDAGNFSDPVCEAGSCNTRCNLGFIECENQCVNLALIANSRALQACAALAGFQDWMRCAGMGENASFCSNECVNITTDERHCGGCWLACTEGQTCEAGDCK